MDGHYPASNGVSRLISPPIDIPSTLGDKEIHLQFFHWFSYPPASYGGWVQIAVYDDTSKQWSGWIDLSAAYINGFSEMWTPVDFDISHYAGKKVKFSFYHNPGSGSGLGWYIDEPRIINPCEADYDNDCDIDAIDLSIVSKEYGFCTNNCVSDVEPNNIIDEADLIPFVIGFGKNNCPTCTNLE